MCVNCIYFPQVSIEQPLYSLMVVHQTKKNQRKNCLKVLLGSITTNYKVKISTATLEYPECHKLCLESFTNFTNLFFAL